MGRSISQEDLRWLVCPVCHGALELGLGLDAILCSGCHRRYPILDGLPVLIASAAK